jgi:glutamyl-tRNA synthetase
MGQDNQKLSKRHGAVTITWYRQHGFLPEAMCNYLALLGWSLGEGDREEFTLQEMAEHFTLERVNKNAARFDLKKLEAINGDWIRRLDADDFAARITPFLQTAGLVAHPPTREEQRVIAGGAPLIQERMTRLTEAAEMLGFLLVDDRHFTVEPEAASRSLTADSRPALEAALAGLEKLDTWQTGEIEATLRGALVEGLDLKPKHAFGPVRVAVTGRRVSPPLFESLELLGRERTLARLRAALDQIDA